MSRLLLSSAIIALSLSSCHHSSTQNTSEHSTTVSEEARVRPRVAVVPVVDHSSSGCRWSLSEEFTTQICDALYQKDNMRLVNPNKTLALLTHAKVEESPFVADYAWVKKVFKDDEFVVFMELIEHQEKYRQEKQNNKSFHDCSADLNLSMRVRVFDLRGAAPRIALQEIIHQSHFIPKQYTEKNHFHPSWNYDSFALSPTGLAHEAFVRDIAAQINAYIVLSVNELP